MKKTLIAIIVIGAVYGLYTVINNPPTQPAPQADDTNATEKGITEVVDANNQFAFDIYSKINETNDGNVFFSPYSISTALSMVYEGAEGETAEEMKSVLHIPSDDSVRRPAIAAVYNKLNPENASYKLNTANAIWPQKEYTILSEYKDTVERYYLGKATNLDFVNKTEESRQTINSWVEDQTNNKIKDLLPEGSVNEMTRLVLTNAVYFKGDWAKQFDKNLTKDETFTISEGNTVEVPMMKNTGKEAKFNYTETEELQILGMPYKDEELSMIVLLPKENNLEYLEENFTEENFSEWMNNANNERRVNVYMPKFTFTTKYNLNQTLKDMGMPLAFTPPSESNGADFSGMSGKKNLFISNIIHQAFVDVNEEGTEAAAATGATMETTSAPINIPEFRADHPFIFIIQDNKTDNILFMGKVVNPSANTTAQSSNNENASEQNNLRAVPNPPIEEIELPDDQWDGIWKTYSNSEYGYTLEYPGNGNVADWTDGDLVHITFPAFNLYVFATNEPVLYNSNAGGSVPTQKEDLEQENIGDRTVYVHRDASYGGAGDYSGIINVIFEMDSNYFTLAFEETDYSSVVQNDGESREQSILNFLEGDNNFTQKVWQIVESFKLN